MEGTNDGQRGGPHAQAPRGGNEQAQKATFLAVLLILIATVSAGCAGVSAAPEGETDPRPSELTTSSNVASEPPGSTLAFGKQSVKGLLGSYCYNGVCKDAAGVLVPPPEETLNGHSRAVLLLDYGGEGRTSVEDASVFPLDPESMVEAPSGGNFLGDAAQPAARLSAEPEGALWKMRADLAPGEYVIYVLLEIPEGDAYYSFRVAVEP